MTIDISHLHPCAEATAYLSTQTDPATAYLSCQRGDWMLWLASRVHLSSSLPATVPGHPSASSPTENCALSRPLRLRKRGRRTRRRKISRRCAPPTPPPHVSSLWPSLRTSFVPVSLLNLL